MILRNTAGKVKSMNVRRAKRVGRRAWLGATAAMTIAGGACTARTARERAGNGQLKVFNWSDYIHEDALAQFEKQHGCSIVYDNYASDSELETRMATATINAEMDFTWELARQVAPKNVISKYKPKGGNKGLKPAKIKQNDRKIPDTLVGE